MGIDIHCLRVILELRNRSFGDVLMIGRQGFNVAENDELRALLVEFNLDMDFAELSDGSGFSEKLFWYLGAHSVSSLDISAFEGAEILHDLNQPIPIELYERYDFIFDGGTLEHVYNVPEAFRSLKRMLRPSGTLLTVNAANNQLGHGLYQFSPDLLWRIFHRDQGFAVRFMRLVPLNTAIPSIDLIDPALSGLRHEIGRTEHATYLIGAFTRSDAALARDDTVYQSDYAAAWSARGPVKIEATPDRTATAGGVPAAGAEIIFDFAAGHQGPAVQGEGWAAPERHGSWSISTNPSLTIFHLAPGQNYHCEMTLAPFLGDGLLASQRVVVAIDHVVVFDAALSQVQLVGFALPASKVRADGSVILAFHLANAASPQLVGQSTDYRMLAVAIARLVIRLVND